MDADERARFEQALLPHLDAAFNLARWLTRNDHDAQDVVQEAFLRAFRYFDTLADAVAQTLQKSSIVPVHAGQPASGKS